MIKFDHIKKNKYGISDVAYIENILNKIDIVLNMLSPDIKKEEFNIAMNNRIFKVLLSRIIVNDFIVTYKEKLKEPTHYTVDINVNNIDFKITIADLTSSKLNGGYIYGTLHI